MSEENREINAGPGKILAAARKEMGLDIKQVAVELHLRPSIVTAIEDEDYSQLPGTIFLKGYIRSYCRLVNLHEERLIEILESQLKTQEDQIREEKRASKRTRKTRRGVMLLVTLVVLAVVAFSAYELTGTSDDTRLDSDMPAQSAPEKQAAADSQPGPQGTNVEASQGETMAHSVSEDVMPAETDGQQEQAPVSPEPISLEPAVQDSSEAEPEPAIQYVAAAQDKEDQPVSEVKQDHLSIVFSDDCWFKMSDGRGKTVFAALKKAGQVVDYQGAGPFKIVLGNANAAKVVFNDKNFDLSKVRSYKGRVEFELKR